MMQIKNFNILTGTTLSLLLCAAAIAPANANSINAQASDQLLAQNNDDMQNYRRGTVKSIAGNLVTVGLDDGDTETFWVPHMELGQLNLRGGTPVYVSDKRIVRVVRPGDLVIVETPTSSDRSERIAQVFEELKRKTTEQRTTVISEPVPSPAPVRRTVTTPRRVQEVEEPVRALW
ncbi:hypothetical protein [Lyngbya aestuarii]|uniref:hypothetical protein n=1 Tax=Lyngbya aestuarii TaxID=118322 RepID=UPI00403DC7F6